MEHEILIKVEGLSKKFCKDLKTSLRYGLYDLRNELFRKPTSSELRPEEFWALHNVSFELKRGECLGLIGHNGAGKSTLLKMINGLIKPNCGRIEIRGRVAALIELGAGFNPILTGRENIYSNASVLGFKKAEIDELIEEIIDFSEVREFIDMPVQFYSSGMKVKLGFSVAAHLKPDVLILDEVLAVGDAGFRIKSFNKISQIIKNAAVIFVSHSMPAISRVCNKVMFMRHGESVYLGNEIGKAAQLYFNEFKGEEASIEINHGAEIEILKVNNRFNDQKIDINYGDSLEIEYLVNIKDTDCKSFFLHLTITDKDMKIVAQYFSYHFSPYLETQSTNQIRLRFDNIQFVDGEYSMSYSVIKTNGDRTKMYEYLATYRNFTKLQVSGLNDRLDATIQLKGLLFHNEKPLLLAKK
jgi:lipopolysaccharide transport system ATP-binding protein